MSRKADRRAAYVGEIEQKVRTGAMSAADAYKDKGTSGSWGRGHFEPIELEARNAKAGIWGTIGTAPQHASGGAAQPVRQMGATTNDPAKMQSAFGSLTNPYTKTYAAQRRMGLDDASDKAFAETDRRMGQAFAGRGVTASSPLAQAGQQQVELARVQQRNANMNAAETDWVDKGAAWDQQAAGQVDNYGLARSGLQLSYNRQPAELAMMGAQTAGIQASTAGQGLQNTFAQRTMGDRVESVGLANAGQRIGNVQAAQQANVYSRTMDDQVAQAQEQTRGMGLGNDAQQQANFVGNATMGDRIAQAAQQTRGMGLQNEALAGQVYEADQGRPDRLAMLRNQKDSAQLANDAQNIQNYESDQTRELRMSQFGQMLDLLRRKEEAGVKLTELEYQQKAWADANAWWLGPLLWGGEVVKGAAGGAGRMMGAAGAPTV